MSGDREPLLFRAMLGTLRPVTAAAEQAARDMAGQVVRVEVKKTTGNTKRMGLYWVVLRMAVEQLADAFDAPMRPKVLHLWLKRQAGLSTPIRSKKTGEIIGWDDDSISFATMPENERARFIDFAFDRLSRRIGCDVATLTHEAQKEAA